MIYDILEKVPPKGSEQRYDPNCFDPTYDYGGKYLNWLIGRQKIAVDPQILPRK